MDLKFRRLERQDFWTLYYWRHERESVKWSFKPPPTAEQHYAWFKLALGQPDHYIGMKRLTPAVAVSVVEGRVSIMVNPLHRKEGLGSQALQFLQNRFDRLSAEVKLDNIGSRRLFEKNGFVAVPDSLSLEWERADAR